MSQFSYCAELEELLQNPSAKGRSGKSIDIASLSTHNNLAVIRSLFLERRPRATLEIGMACGGSTLVFSSSHRDLKAEPAKQHVAIDPFQETVYDAAGLEAVRRAGLDAFVDFRGEMSAFALASLVQEGRQFDLCYIDGSHLFEDVFVDWYFLARLTSHEGLLLFDDCTDRHVRKFIRFLKRNFRDDFAEIDLSAHRPDKGGLRYQIGRNMGWIQLRGFVKRGPGQRKWNAPFVEF